MAWKWNRRTHPRYNGSGGNFGRCLELFSTYIYYATYHTPTTVHLSNYMPGVFTRVQTKYSQTTPNQFECENVDLKRFPSTTHSVMFLMGKSILWLPPRTRTATQQPTMEGVRRCAIFDDLRAAQRESPVRSFAQQGGLIHLHGIPLNVAEKSNEARTQVVHYSSAESGTHTRWPFYNTVLGDRLETGTHPESQPHGTCAAQSQRAHANGTANKFPIKAVPLRLHTI